MKKLISASLFQLSVFYFHVEKLASSKINRIWMVYGTEVIFAEPREKYEHF